MSDAKKIPFADGKGGIAMNVLCQLCDKPFAEHDQVTALRHLYGIADENISQTDEATEGVKE